EDAILAVDLHGGGGAFHAFDRTRQFRPHLLVLRLGPVLTRLPPHHLVHHVVGTAHEWLDGIDTTHAGHPLLVGLFALLTPTAFDRLILAHRHPFAVTGQHQDRAFLLDRRRRLRLAERTHLL